MGEGWTRNAHGVKDGANMYRTIKGVRWEWWSAGNIDALRTAGLRCRKSGGEIFIHPDDEERAWTLTYGSSGNSKSEEK
jgi:hypothetical protein